MNIYALYDGETLIADGSIREIAIQTGIPEGSVRWYGSKNARERNISKALIKLEEDDDMFLGSNQVRSQRTHTVYAPTTTKYEMDDTAPVKTTYRPIQMKPFKFESRWINYQLDGMFKNW